MDEQPKLKFKADWPLIREVWATYMGIILAIQALIFVLTCWAMS